MPLQVALSNCVCMVHVAIWDPCKVVLFAPNTRRINAFASGIVRLYLTCLHVVILDPCMQFFKCAPKNNCPDKWHVEDIFDMLLSGIHARL